MVAGTATGDDVAAVTKVRVGPIAEMVLSAWVAASDFAAAVNVQLRSARMEMEWVG